MDAKEILRKIKEAFDFPGAAAPAAPVAAPAAPVMTKDGKSLVVDKMEAGGVVMLDGMPAPAGSYELEDGSVLTVTDGGVISEVKPAIEQAADPVAPAPIAPVIPAPVQQLSAEEFAELRTDYHAFKAQFDAYKHQVETRVHLAEQTISKQDSTITQLLDLMNNIVNAPQTEVPAGQKKAFAFLKSETKDATKKNFSSALEQIHNTKY